jgi:hypothetical protein
MVRDGLSTMELIPDVTRYLDTAESLHCAPWEMFEADETPPPKAWWREMRMIYDIGIADGRRQQNASKKH